VSRGADWLARWFGPEVTEPVRLHVAAKRYLCTIFLASPYAEDSCRVRRWDDDAKDPGAAVPPFTHFALLLSALAR